MSEGGSRKRWIALITLVFAVGVIAFVAAMPKETTGPPEIKYGEDACDRCRMVISDERFAAGLRTGDGQVKKFDDVGEMALWIEESVSEPLTELWVKDFQTLDWIDARSAVYVHAPSFHTPMGFNVAALATRKQAEAIALEWDGTILAWADLPIVPSSGHEHRH